MSGSIWNSISADDEAEILDLLDVELALCDVRLEAELPQSLKHLSYMLFVFLQRVAVNQDIVEIGSAENIEVLSQGVVDVMLE